MPGSALQSLELITRSMRDKKEADTMAVPASCRFLSLACAQTPAARAGRADEKAMPIAQRPQKTAKRRCRRQRSAAGHGYRRAVPWRE